MDFDDYANLVDVYRDWQRDMRCGDWGKSSLTAPLLVDPTERYLSADRRILIVGQETRGWGWAGAEEHARRAGLTGNGYGDIWTLQGFLEANDGVDAMLAAYRAFAFAEHDAVTRRSPFWSAFRRFDKAPGQATLWTNLCRCAFDKDEGDAGGHSLQRLEPTIRDAFVGVQSSLALEEFRILRPNACFLLTGPDYDGVLADTLPGIRLEPVAGFPERKLARVAHSALPEASYRTYHPAYLRRAGLEEEILGKLQELADAT